MKSKGWKTTTAAFAFFAFLVALVVVFILKEITLDELKTILTISTPPFVLIIGWLAKDQSGTHTK